MVNQSIVLPDTLVLFGPNGGGKGTQAKQLMQEFGCSHFEMSQALKEAVNQIVQIEVDGVGVEMTVGQAQAHGYLIPDSEIQKIVDEDLKKRRPSEKRIYDGVGRTLLQAENFVNSLRKFQLFDGTRAAFFDVPEKQARAQIAMRAYLEGRPDDAQPEAVDRRLDAFYTKTIESVNYFRSLGKLLRVDGSSNVDFDRILRILEDLRLHFTNAIDLSNAFEAQEPDIVLGLRKSVQLVTSRLFEQLA